MNPAFQPSWFKYFALSTLIGMAGAGYITYLRAEEVTYISAPQTVLKIADTPSGELEDKLLSLIK